MTIDTSTRPTRVRDHLLDYIDKNQLGPGDQLPSEAEMARNLGVSRNTIREAYITLEAEGSIVRKHGIGTFVSRSPLIKESLFDEVIGFPNSVRSAGYISDFKIISIGHVTPAAEVSRVLQVNPDEELLQVRFVQFANGVPATLITDYYPSWVDESKFDWDTFDGNMLDFVAESLSITERHFYTRIIPVLSDDEVSDHLAIPVGIPIINIRSTITTIEGRPLTYSVVYLNPKNIEFELRRVYRHS